jgi:hypothetical protein
MVLLIHDKNTTSIHNNEIIYNYKTTTKQLQNNYKTTTKQLQNNYKTIGDWKSRMKICWKPGMTNRSWMHDEKT